MSRKRPDPMHISLEGMLYRLPAASWVRMCRDASNGIDVLGNIEHYNAKIVGSVVRPMEWDAFSWKCEYAEANDRLREWSKANSSTSKILP